MAKDTVYGYFTVSVPNEQDEKARGYICIRLDRPPLKSDSKKFKASFSFCAPPDANKFSRPKARRIADCRMNTKRIKTFIEFEYNKTDDTKLPELFEAAFSNITTVKKDLPRWLTEGITKPGYEVKYGLHDTIGTAEK